MRLASELTGWKINLMTLEESEKRTEAEHAQLRVVFMEKLDLDEDAILLLQMIPLRGCIDDRIPTDPTMYRFYEMLQVYGTTLKALVHEKFGDGIISAINFKLDVKKVADPEGGERAVITLDGKYLPTKPF